MWKIISPAQCSSVCKYSGDCMFDVAQMTQTQHQRRASAAHLAGLSILGQQHAALTGWGRVRNSSVFIIVLLTRDVLLPSGVICKAAGIIETVVINVNMMPLSHSLKSSDSVILCQVRDFNKPFTLLFH